VPASSHWSRSVCLALIALHLLAQPAPTHNPSTETSTSPRDAQSYRTLDALDRAIKAAARSGVDTAALTAQAKELRLQLNRAVDDTETNEITTRAANLMEELANRGGRQERSVAPPPAPAVIHRPRAATPPAAAATLPISSPATPDPEEQPTSHLPLILSGIAILFSLAAVVIAPILCKSAIEKALRSAGLQ
jgi:hypothetical protein